MPSVEGWLYRVVAEAREIVAKRLSAVADKALERIAVDADDFRAHLDVARSRFKWACARRGYAFDDLALILNDFWSSAILDDEPEMTATYFAGWLEAHRKLFAELRRIVQDLRNRDPATPLVFDDLEQLLELLA